MKVRHFVYKVRGYIFAQIVLSMIATIAIAFIPVCNERLIDIFFAKTETNLWGLVLVYIALFSVFLFSTWGSERFVWKSAITFENMLKKECYAKILNLKYENYEKKKSDEYLSLLTNNITSIEQDYLQPLCALIKSFVSVVVYTYIISIYTSPIICVSLLFLSVVAAFSPKLYQKQLRRAGKEYVDEAAFYTKKTADLLEGAEMVETDTRAAFKKENATYTDSLSRKRYKLGRAKVNGNTISGATICLIDTVVFSLCGILMLNGNITVGIFVAAITYAQSFTEPIQEILYDINTLNASKDIVKSLEKMIEVCDQNSEEFKNTNWQLNDIVLQNACVSFPEKKIYYNARFNIGEKYLITGQSGRGKTTLLNVITGRKQSEGDCHRISKRDCFYLSQHQHIFSDSAVNNISIFGTYSDFDVIKNTDIPMYDRVCNAADCSVLSGGELQIIKLCRMLVQHKPVLILDEPFAALDNNNARIIFHELSMMAETIILVSHITEFEEDDLKKWVKIQIEDICYEEKI